MQTQIRPTFDAELRAALAERGLPLARVQARLAAAGHPVAMSTISQWQRGHRLPRSPRSLAVVDELERILDLTPGRLHRLAEDEPGRPAVPPTVVSYASAFTGLLERLGHSSYGSLETLSTHERITLDATGALSHRENTTTMQAATPTDRHVIAHGVDPGGDVDLVTIAAVRGCRLGRVIRDTAAGVVAAELHFDRRLSPGDTVVYDVRIEDANGIPSHDYYRWTIHPIPLLVLEVCFDRALVPTTVSAFRRDRSDAPDAISGELSLERGDRVHLVRHPACPGAHGIRWTWPTRTPGHDDAPPTVR